MLVPLVAAASLFFFIFLPNVGLLDYYLGRRCTAPNWLGDSDVALWSIMASRCGRTPATTCCSSSPACRPCPTTPSRRRIIDGANAWQRLRYVILPALKPTIAFVAVIALLKVVTQVDHVIVLTKGGPSNSTNLLLFYIYQPALENYDIGKASAATLLIAGGADRHPARLAPDRWRVGGRGMTPIDCAAAARRPAGHAPRDLRRSSASLLVLARVLPVADAVPVDAGRLVPARRPAGSTDMAVAAARACMPTPGEFPRRLRDRRFPASTTSTPRSSCSGILPCSS